MTILNALKPLVATTRAATPEARNVLLHPAGPAPAVREGTLMHAEGGLLTDADPALRPRVSAILGPGATFDGVAAVLLPLFANTATPVTLDMLGRALIAYNQNYLATTNFSDHLVGLRLPLPIEIDATGWIVSVATLTALAAGFPPALENRRTTTPGALPLPDPFGLAGDANAVVAANAGTPGTLPTELWRRTVTNPFAEVFLVPAVFRGLAADPAGELALGMVEASVDHQLQLLAGLSAGNAILRLLATVLGRPQPTLDAARLTAAQDRLEAALHTGAVGQRALVPHRELPETATQLASRGQLRFRLGDVAAAGEPAGGLHRLVLGRDICVGQALRFRDDAGTLWIGFEFEGRVGVAAVARAHPTLANPSGDARTAARLEIIEAIAANEAQLDGARALDADLLSSGIHQWGVPEENELSALLNRYKGLAPDEFDVLFGLYGLDVRPDPANAAAFQLLRVQPPCPPVVLAGADRLAFFGGTRPPGTTNQITLTSDWVARFRLAALVSEDYLRAEFQEAAARFDRIRSRVGSVRVGTVGGATTGGTLVPLPDLVSSKLGAALILDTHINQPSPVPGALRTAARAPIPTNADQRDRTVTNRFHDERSVHDRTARNTTIDAQHLDAAHGSFAGW